MISSFLADTFPDALTVANISAWIGVFSDKEKKNLDIQPADFLLRLATIRILYRGGSTHMRRLIVAAVGFILLVASGAKAQDLANLVGTVSDSSGAMVADVRITVSNPERGFVRTAQSDQGGEYSFARVPLGA